MSMDRETATAWVAYYLAFPLDLAIPEADGIDVEAAIDSVQTAIEPLDWYSLQ